VTFSFSPSRFQRQPWNLQAKLGVVPLALPSIKAAPAMEAHVVEGADPLRRGTGEDYRFVADVVDHVAADMVELLDPAGDLPDARPQRGISRFSHSGS
jgi:hypothetical protein